MSKEHLFADWLRELFPRSPTDTHTLGEALDGIRFQLTNQQGHSGSRKIRTVCEACNNGWVSEIDENAKGVALPIIQGEDHNITQVSQLFLVRWFTKMTMVADSRRRLSSVVTQSDRDYFRQKKIPPPSWEIWIASYNGSDWRDLGFFQRSGMLDFTPIAGRGANFSGYAITGCAGIGRLLTLTIGTDVPGMEFDVGTLRDFARRIWPLGDAFDWPMIPIGDDKAAAVANILQAMVARIRGD